MLVFITAGSPNFFVTGSHKLSHNSSGAGYLTYEVVSGYVTFYHIHKCFVEILFFHY